MPKGSRHQSRSLQAHKFPQPASGIEKTIISSKRDLLAHVIRLLWPFPLLLEASGRRNRLRSVRNARTDVSGRVRSLHPVCSQVLDRNSVRSVLPWRCAESFPVVTVRQLLGSLGLPLQLVCSRTVGTRYLTDAPAVNLQSERRHPASSRSGCRPRLDVIPCSMASLPPSDEIDNSQGNRSKPRITSDYFVQVVESGGPKTSTVARIYNTLIFSWWARHRERGS